MYIVYSSHLYSRPARHESVPEYRIFVVILRISSEMLEQHTPSASFDVLSSSLLTIIQPFDANYSEVLTASIMKPQILVEIN